MEMAPQLSWVACSAVSSSVIVAMASFDPQEVG
jgi:hypothetical protein